MPSSTLTTVQDLSDQIGRKAHNFASDTIKVALTNSVPLVTNTILADITQIAATGGYVAGAGGGYALSGVSYSEAAGVATFSHTSLVITASGGSVGPFRYAVYYNDTATAPVDALIGWIDYGSALTLLDTETLTITDASGVFKITS